VAVADELRTVGGLNHLALPPVRPSAPDDPLAMIAPAEPAPAPSAQPGPSAAASAVQTLFGRSGVDLEQLLAAQDAIDVRPTTERGELEQGLQQARAALVKRQPADTLRALNDVWPRAQYSEEAWYLRAGALTAMGMPVEADDVAAEALEERPTSLALRYAQSLARTVHGDLAGARSVLGPALDRAPDVPVLRAHLAQLLARQGRVTDAENELRILARYFPGHPAITWAEGLVRRERTTKLRDGSVRAEEPGGEGSAARPQAAASATTATPASPPTPAPSAPSAAPATPATPSTPAAPAEAAMAADAPRDPERFGDPIRLAFRRLGALIADPDALALGETRLLQRAFAGGGTMATVGPPEQQHAARSILVSIAAFLTGEPAEAQPMSPTMDTLLSALHKGQAADALKLLKREGHRFTPMQRKLLEALVEGIAPVPAPTIATPRIPTPASPMVAAPAPVASPSVEPPPVVSGPAAPAPAAPASVVQEVPLVPEDEHLFLPIRLGLSLLHETPQARAADYAAAQALGPGERLIHRDDGHLPLAGDEGWREVLPPPPDAGLEGAGVGWGAAAAAAQELPTVLVPPSTIPLSVIILTMLVVMTGIAFGPGPAVLVGVAIWFARGQRSAPPA
jgi:tetratricopeptide (TPR) repeat protein